MADETERLAGFLYEIGLLKRYRRTGWLAWIDSSLAQLRTGSARRLAEQAQKTGSLDWLARALNGPGEP
ncbi:hypothetical protein BKA00_006867 [Actinomadura coerulea]|uniref:Uncharacterized protein n=1 Tax=Actinomadura coerulea TaxID=46159 RepID=A0A7X0G5R7_9ACTN|nr:hypothetical protein [Actinomadura coerulea]MBB6399953.1 hypothetical protein [Actinomadura coerulea]GGQ17193.1 hypothetical protein GCM10010187_36880 [Actinomadura coerulea]